MILYSRIICVSESARYFVQCRVMLKPTRLLLQLCWAVANPELAGEEKRICAEASQKISKETEKLCNTFSISVNKNKKLLDAFRTFLCLGNAR